MAGVMLAGCREADKEPAPVVRPVRTVTVEQRKLDDSVSLTGHIEAENQVSFAFRLGGRVIERLVNVGDQVEPGQILARLDPQNEISALRTAQANLVAAEGQLVKTQNAFERQDALLQRGFTTRAQFDAAQQAVRAAQSQVDSSQAQLDNAEDRVGFTELHADAAGAVTAVGAEPGEVVQAGQMVLQVARQDGRDAVFDVPAQLLRQAPETAIIDVALTDDPTVKATGRVREIAPQADPTTRTFRVRVGLTDTPAAMRLGSTVTGRVTMASSPEIALPASALTKFNQQPAVWIVDQDKKTVTTRNVEILRFDPATVIISQGLNPGEVVVTAGVQALHDGQEVRLLGSTQ
ncbi:efflux RND transporter periplasmic adaptor subunit [Phyllobacterium sp. 2063]|nr:efflux RND transporter periplasmic adaptor subunit [Phyllobacterium sp. 2063]MBZ9655990.1 efflux RND transporter periplasmic adaptor subunit [Phyllobacterium sp. 2063]